MKLSRLTCSSLLLAAGCASGGASSTSTRPTETIRVASTSGGAVTLESHPSVSAAGGTVPFGMEPSWAALRAAYDSLALPVASFHPESRTIGTPMNMRVLRRLGKAALSKYLNCGDTQGRPAADSYEVRMTVQSMLQPVSASATDLQTTVVAEATPITFSGSPVRCTSTGNLEMALKDLVTSQLQR